MLFLFVFQVIKYIQMGQILDKPEICNDATYAIMLRCWKRQPHERLSMLQIHRKLEDLISNKADYLDIVG